MNYDNNKVEKENSSKLFVIVIALLIFIIAVIGVSFATFTYTKEKSSINTISTGSIYLSYDEDSNGINITNALPMTDETGMNLTDENYYFDFSVQASINGDVTANYEISALKDVTSTLDNSDVRLYLEKKINNSYEEVMAPKAFTPLSEDTNLGTKAGSMLLDTGSFSKSTVISYRLRMWLGSNAVIDNLSRTFKVRVSVNAKVDLND